MRWQGPWSDGHRALESDRLPEEFVNLREPSELRRDARELGRRNAVEDYNEHVGTTNGRRQQRLFGTARALKISRPSEAETLPPPIRKECTDQTRIQ